MSIIHNEYVDGNDALKRIGGNIDLYKRLLRQFSEEDCIGPLEEALSANAMEEASRLIHALKGVSANLSLVKLSMAAIELEQKVKNGEDYLAEFTELKNIYSITSQQIAEIL